MTPRIGRYRDASGNQDRLDLRLELFGEVDKYGSHGIVSGDILVGEKVIPFLSASRVGKPGLSIVPGDSSASNWKAHVRFGSRNFKSGTWGTLSLQFSSQTRARLQIDCPSGAYKCFEILDVAWKDKYFRELTLELDRIASASFPSSVKWRGQTWTVAKVFETAGFKTRVIKNDTKIPDEPDAWTDGELHEAMERWRQANRNPWSAHVLIVSRYYDDTESELTLGIMFDVQPRPGDPPREGCAVFVDSVKDTLDSPRSNTVLQREFIMTVAHEVGHALNLLHSFDKGRSDSASLMNYPEEFDRGADAYYEEFAFAFDQQELLHLRHHSREVVEPGFADGIEWGVDEFRRVPRPPRATARRALTARKWIEKSSAARVQTERTLRSALVLDLTLSATSILPGEPLIGLVTLRRRPTRELALSSGLKIATSLDWATRGVTVQIRSADDGLWESVYSPIRRCSRVRPRLVSSTRVVQNELRLVMGREGDLFRRAGKYDVRVRLTVWRGQTATALYSRAIRIEVRAPATSQERTLGRLFARRDLKRMLAFRGGATPIAASNAARRIANLVPRTGVAQLCRLTLALRQLSGRPVPQPRSAARTSSNVHEAQRLLAHMRRDSQAMRLFPISLPRIERRYRITLKKRNIPRVPH